MFDLTGKNALVTGASGGIGGAIARALSSAGASVALSGTRASALEELVEKLGDNAYAITAERADVDGPDILAKAALKRFGRIDILVNNAGFTRDSLVMRMKEEDWQKVLDVNLTAAFPRQGGKRD